MLEHIDANKDTIATHPRMLGMVSVAKDVSHYIAFSLLYFALLTMSCDPLGITFTTLFHA